MSGLKHQERGVSLDLLREYLTDNTTPEHYQLFIRGFDLFRDYDLEDFEDHFEAVLVSTDSEEVDPSTTLIRLDLILKELLLGVVTEHGVTLDPEATTARTLEYAEAIYGLDKHDLVQDVVRICESDDDDLGRLSALLELGGGLSAEEYLLDLWDVSSGLLDRVGEQYQALSAQYEVVEDLEEIKAYHMRYRYFLEFLGTHNTRVNRLLKTGLVVGLDYSDYIDRFSAMFDQLAEANQAVELYGFIVISKQWGENPMATIEQHFEYLYDDLDRAQRVRQILTNIMHRYSEYLDTRTTEA